MHSRANGAITAFLVLFAVGCGNRHAAHDPDTAEKPSVPVPSTRQVTLHVKDMT